jgi:hypothetical protein
MGSKVLVHGHFVEERRRGGGRRREERGQRQDITSQGHGFMDSLFSTKFHLLSFVTF